MENRVPNDRVWAELSNLIDRPEAFVPKFRGICFFCSRQSLIWTVRRSNAGHQEVYLKREDAPKTLSKRSIAVLNKRCLESVELEHP